MGKYSSEATTKSNNFASLYQSEIDFGTTSEFFLDSYDVANISEIFKSALSRAFDRLKRSDDLDFERAYFVTVSCFNDAYGEMMGFEALNDMYLDGVTGIEKISALEDYDELVRDDESVKPEYVHELMESYCAILKDFHDNRRFFEPKLASRYLDSFFELSKAMVFSVDSYNLASTIFRKSTFLKILLSFAAKQIKCTAADPEDKERQINFVCYEYSFFDPFAYDTIARALVCATKLVLDEVKTTNAYDEDLFELRKAMFVCSVESAFQRTVTLDKQSYRIELNRHTSKLVAYPVDMLSSTSDTKPIRLFEKTAAYIRNNIVPSAELFTVRVTIIGHSEISQGKAERSMADYIAEILTWYNDLTLESSEMKKPRLQLTIRNILSFAGKPDILEGDVYNLPEERIPVDLKLEGHSAICTFEQIDYEKKFAYSLKELKSCIDDSELIFLLDCPWLSTENYSIGKEGSLYNYCSSLQRKNRNYIQAEERFNYDSSYFYRASPMTELSDQYNRIMSSSSLSAGSVVRSMRDDMIRKIQQYMDTLRDNNDGSSAKELYIFSSENEGVNYSYIDSYPLTRLEQYDGKHFTIIQFSNKKLPMLKCNSTGRVQFNIDLWSVLKYLCIPYAYHYAVQELLINCDVAPRSNNRAPRLDIPIQYLELLQNIVVAFDISNDLRKIHISVGFTSSFDELISNALLRREKTSEKERIINDFKENVEKKVVTLVTPLYRDSVFTKNRKYGDDAIKLGFKMTLYSAATDVNTMLFCHLYREACSRGDFSRFAVSFGSQGKCAQFCPRDFKSASFFADKKIYSFLLSTFERDYRLYLGMVKMLEEAKSIYKVNGKNSPDDGDNGVIRILFENVQTACEQAELGDSRLNSNLLRALSNLSE